ncbi:MAG: AI-2E family transporter [Ktedonobacterales bacterium]|nr:AI-2E family transporter [Ktedonobacterales bacterium]
MISRSDANGTLPDGAPGTIWAERRDQVLVALGITAFVFLALWLASHVARSLIILGLAALVAYALSPVVAALSRRMPRMLALIIVYLVLIGALGGLIFLVINTAVTQLTSLVPQISHFLAPGADSKPSPLVQTLYNLGLSQQQIDSFSQQLTAQLGGFASNVVPLITGFVNSVLDLVLILVISVYLIIDGQRVTAWLRTSTPMAMRGRIISFLETLRHVIGGYIRGQLIMSTLIGVLVGGGMAVFQVPYALLLGVLAFILEFIPILGTITSGIICVLIALTQGYGIALGVLIYFIVVHVIEGDVVGPRILSRAVGVHPAVSMVALIAGSELFGVLGALLASPVAGLTQAVIADLYQEWRKTTPAQFPDAAHPLVVAAEAIAATSAPHPADSETPADKAAARLPE